MLSLLPVALFGFAVGLRHATEADHVAAVSAIVARERTVWGAALVGAAWGVGHTITLWLLGGAIVVFGLTVPRSLALALELLVGAMLIGLGLWNFLSRRTPAHAHVAASSSASDVALSSACGAANGRSPVSVRASIRRAVKPLVVGSMHGLAGSAAAALLVAATARTVTGGLAYLAVLGLGTLLGMTMITAVLAWPLGGAVRRFDRAEAWLRVGSGAASCAIGAMLVYQIGFRDGFFLH